MELGDLTPELVMEKMDQIKPGWWLEWANGTDLQQVLAQDWRGNPSKTPEQQKEFLRTRSRDRVWLALHAASILLAVKGARNV